MSGENDFLFRGIARGRGKRKRQLAARALVEKEKRCDDQDLIVSIMRNDNAPAAQRGNGGRRPVKSARVSSQCVRRVHRQCAMKTCLCDCHPSL